MKQLSEYEIRLHAIRIWDETRSYKRAMEAVQRSRGWLAKWLRRYRVDGAAGLQDRSRAPRHIRNRTAAGLVRKILALRDELEAHTSRRAAFAGRGAETIHHELTLRGVRRLPALSTIEKILARAGRTKKRKTPRCAAGPPYPYPPARRMGDVHQTALVGPRFLRGPQGVTRYYSFHTLDPVGQTASASQSPDKQTLSLCRHLVASWQVMGVPIISQMDNEMAASGGGRYRYSLSQVIRLHLLLGVHMVFIPRGEPGRNAGVESFNGLWQKRVLRHPCPDLRTLRRYSRRFMAYYHFQKPSRRLTRAEHDTRFPGLLRDRLWPTLQHLPEGFSLEAFRDAQGRLAFPLAKGHVSYVRKVDGQGRIEFNGASYYVGRALEHQYVVATLSTHHRRVFITAEGRHVKSIPFPFVGQVVEPLLRARKSSRCPYGS
ncbi:MAG: helix-turn-helix domain containing protein, partial [Candidatus Aminicenantes bacterium]|nr:helix-turn-helix domain containing protein [Candidatus Aminicenantes bacterium]